MLAFTATSLRLCCVAAYNSYTGSAYTNTITWLCQTPHIFTESAKVACSLQLKARELIHRHNHTAMPDPA